MSHLRLNSPSTARTPFCINELNSPGITRFEINTESLLGALSAGKLLMFNVRCSQQDILRYRTHQLAYYSLAIPFNIPNRDRYRFCICLTRDGQSLHQQVQRNRINHRHTFISAAVSAGCSGCPGMGCPDVIKPSSEWQPVIGILVVKGKTIVNLCLVSFFLFKSLIKLRFF